MHPDTGASPAEVRKKLFPPFREKFTIDVPGPDDLEMKGDLLDHEVQQELLSWRYEHVRSAAARRLKPRC